MRCHRSNQVLCGYAGLIGGMIILSMTREARALDIWVNQVGFEPNAPKILRAQRSTDYAGDGTFQVKRATDGSVAFSGTLSRTGPLWNRFYWQGDFSDLHELGNFTISATVNGETGTSYGFTIGLQTLLSQTGTLAFRYYMTQRCGSAVTDPYDGVFWHAACHLDDGIRSDTFQHIDAVGGWHDSGDYNKFPQGFAADGVFALLWLYNSNPAYYDALDLDHNGVPDIIDEARYQARWLVKMIDTNGHCFLGTRINRSGATFVQPQLDTNNTVCSCSNMSTCDACDDRWIDPGDENTPQETVCCAALIRMHRVLAAKGLPTENFAAKALSTWNHRVALAISQGGHNNLGAAAHQIWAGLDLYAVFGQQDCYDRALQRVEELASGDLSNPSNYDSIVGAEAPGYELGVLAWFIRAYPDTYPVNDARSAVQTLMDHNINYLASDPIGLIQRDDSGTLQYFPTNSDNDGFFLGINRLYLLLTWGAIEAHMTINNPAYLRFALDQYNWVLGANYDRVCMIQGAGDFNPPSYHQRLYKVPGHATGAQPGVVPNGYVRTYTTGLPQFDLTGQEPARYQTNEGWLINNAGYALALADMTIFQDGAAYVSDTIPATMTAGHSYNVSITMKNSSYVKWDPTRYRLGAVGDSDPFAATRQMLPAAGVDVGGQNTFTFTMTVPSQLGTYTTDWQMVQESVNWFGDTLTRQVQVVSAGAPSPVTQFSATPEAHQITLTWTNPASANFTGTMIRWSTVSPPSDPTQGTLLVDKPALPGSNDSTIHTGLSPRTIYFYAAFAHNEISAYATPATLSAVTLSIYDFDHDGDVDMADFAQLQKCMSGDSLPYHSGCAAMDTDGDGDVDAADFSAFLPCMKGANQAPGC